MAAAACAVEIDLDGYRIRRAGTFQPLTRIEREIIALLIRRHGQVLSRQEFLDTVWGTDSEVGFSSVDNVIARLRAKLTLVGGNARWIETVRGRGYRWVGPPKERAATPAPSPRTPSS